MEQRQKERENQLQQNILQADKDERKEKQVSPSRKKWGESPPEPILAVSTGEQTGKITEGK